MKRIGWWATAVLLWLMWLMLAAGAGAQADATAQMQLGNRLYEDGRYAAAAQAYQQLVDNGIHSSDLYFNLGNAYYQAGDLGRAILNYERAARLAPRDTAVQTSLALARAQTIDQYEPEEGLSVSQLALLARSWLTLNEMAWATLILWWLTALLWLLVRRVTGEPWRHRVRYVLLLVGFLWLGGVLALGTRLYVDQMQREGVIVAAEVAVADGPGPQATELFTLHSGSKVTLVERRGEWMRLALPGGQTQGWAPAVAVAAVE